ncbi:nickel-dependent lactate racemase [Candidatus Clostridium radicumherbarum]|uniref:Nickel-dependent lactate racemase n=1 Tax=Candidatus Clostridium radicumherbarum TaxID=3381662 RepID=A0ABW8TPC8_9CLOT
MNISMKYGSKAFNLNFEYENIKIISSLPTENIKSEDVILKAAMQNPIDSPRLKDIVKPNEDICIVIPDITRLWQKPSVYLPYIIKELQKAGVEDKNIHFLCALGTHRKLNEEEHKLIVGEELFNRFKITDHDSRDESKLLYVGTTSFGTEVYINKLALQCKHIILAGGIVFHDLAGFGGGRKGIMPGISSYKTVMQHHSISLNPNGAGSNSKVRAALLEGNPFNDDMMEAAAFVKPSFLFNVILDSEGNFTAAVAGNYVTAHKKGCEILKSIDSSNIKEKADVVIASCGGYPKDIDLYQGSKALSNAVPAVKEGGTIILLAECIEGLGHEDMNHIFYDFKNNIEREQEVRRDYTIARFFAFVICEMAIKYNLVLVSFMDVHALDCCNIKITRTLEEAINCSEKAIKNANLIYLMPTAGNTLPILL